MKKAVAGFAMLLALGAVAEARTINVWGQQFEVSEFHPQTVDVGTITDMATHHKMNVVKLRNGHMMALVSMDKYFRPRGMTEQEDMLQ